MNKNQKIELRKLSAAEIDERIEELRKEKVKLENKMRIAGRRQYPGTEDPKNLGFGNVKKIRKTIAFLMTVKNENNKRY